MKEKGLVLRSVARNAKYRDFLTAANRRSAGPDDTIRAKGMCYRLRSAVFRMGSRGYQNEVQNPSVGDSVIARAGFDSLPCRLRPRRLTYHPAKRYPCCFSIGEAVH